jgi:hypothetical protein
LVHLDQPDLRAQQVQQVQQVQQDLRAQQVQLVLAAVAL